MILIFLLNLYAKDGRMLWKYHKNHVSENWCKMNTQEYTEPLKKRRIYNVATI